MKQKLVEKILIDLKRDNVSVEYKEQLIEAKSEKKSYESKLTLKNVPVSRYIENENGRIYSKTLWENVKKSKCFEGSSCFADHKDDPSVLDTTGIWTNFKVLDEIAVADLSLVGPNGKLLQEILESEGKCGFSTVGYGELSEGDNKTVKDDSYEYQHTDWVHQPSQGTFATKENMTETANPVSDVKETKNIIQENKDNEVHTMDKFFEINMKNQVNQRLREAENNDNISEAIVSLSEIEGLTEVPSLKEKVDNTISVLQRKLSEQKKNAESELETIKGKYEESNKALSELKEKYNKVTSVTKKLGIDSITDIKTLKENAAVMEKDVYKLLGILKEMKIKVKEEKADMLSDIKIFEEERSDMLSDIEIFEEEIENRDADIEIFVEERKTMKSDINKLAKALSEAEKKISYYEKFLIKEGYILEAEEDDDEEDDDDKMAKVRAAQKEAKAKKKKAKESDDEDEDEDEELSEAEEDEDEEDDEEDKKAEKKEKKKEAIIRKYVNSEIAKNPSLKSIRNELLSSNSLTEAIKKVVIFTTRRMDEGIHRISESKVDSNDWTRGRF